MFYSCNNHDEIQFELLSLYLLTNITYIILFTKILYTQKWTPYIVETYLHISQNKIIGWILNIIQVRKYILACRAFLSHSLHFTIPVNFLTYFMTYLNCWFSIYTVLRLCEYRNVDLGLERCFRIGFYIFHANGTPN